MVGEGPGGFLEGLVAGFFLLGHLQSPPSSFTDFTGNRQFKAFGGFNLLELSFMWRDCTGE